MTKNSQDTNKFTIKYDKAETQRLDQFLSQKLLDNRRARAANANVNLCAIASDGLSFERVGIGMHFRSCGRGQGCGD